MATQDRKTTGTHPVEEEETEAVPAPAPEAEASTETEGVDDLLDEIDGVLESNAEEFVRGFIQKGGQ
ncbi:MULTISPECIES: ubiquitin-like protein Pup [unclassified Arthrobacter]|uniref:ubiquitin-like protein Pup n=1 Tax=unclassified Arthrobacter TaxID=235627 RepID=UPI001E2A24D1|nr:MULTISPECIES: ubiquitin-like protein Pup [unclassified Arthrobacter]MCC9145430.1 ubiquitin-like protein Pup [Arthrobacter sp. zg-Y919]MDK1276658.1 ubiquitin-like protein Pup [Arthrobacter sp. zg.Y919]WIB04394.1 ubiquitin-like protein Pup [Arthrobacter sp. zg-Y919]